MFVLKIAIYLLLLLFVHELSHVLIALVLSLQITKIGVSYLPVPHIQVSITVKKKWKQILFLLSGLILELFLFAGLLPFVLLSNKALFIALSIQIMIDSNPFYSDALFAIEKGAAFYSGPVQDNPYLFTPKWYLLLLFWIVEIGVFILVNSTYV